MLSLHYLSLLLPLLPLSLAAVNGPCSIDGTPGVCVTTANCAAIDGSFRSGFCKNDVENVKCCIKPECGSGGNCRPTNTCDGTTKTGLCPGSSNFKCCEPKAGGNPPPPPPSGGGATTGDLKLSAKGVEFIAGFEGFRANYYNDAAGVRTIGYGHACQEPGECPDAGPITEARGKELLNSDADAFEKCVNADVKVALNQNQFDALVSFAFNLGCGNLRNIADDLNKNDFSGATANMKKYVNAGGNVLAGLVRRRNAESLLDEVDELKESLESMESERAREKTAAMMSYQSLQTSQAAMTTLQRSMFLDALIKKLEVGGEEAAELLRTSIRKYLMDEVTDIQADMEPIVRVFANMRGLGKTLVDAKILESPEDLGRFVCGFNKKFTSFDFIDAGNGKECSDAKLKKSFELFICNVHCKHVIFGGSPDNGYARLLNSYTGDSSTNNMITMLEGPPFATELIPIVEKLKQCSFPKVFRDTKIPPRRVSFSTTPPRSKSPALTSYASTAATAKIDTLALIMSPKADLQAKGVIPRNTKGQRVDFPIKVTQTAVQFIKSQKWCKNHRLLGYCVYNDSECAYQHKPALTEARLNALRVFARQMPCENGLGCDDPDCYYGHRCRGDPCKFYPCNFPQEMHNVDTKVVNC
ncbi:MAG: hypothetical protein L6R42_007100 [Xanthoria sp. 1 TBL-2021]|nr:MAG: hypothetical protein L6R42_007100 [Xanthoria sp. 1 TBL-2021]